MNLKSHDLFLAVLMVAVGSTLLAETPLLSRFHCRPVPALEVSPLQHTPTLAERSVLAKPDSTNNVRSGEISGGTPSNTPNANSGEGPDATVVPNAPPSVLTAPGGELIEGNLGDVAEPQYLIRERYSSRALKIEREVVADDDVKYRNHGAWRMFDERGNVIAQGAYQNGERHGRWTRWLSRDEAELFSRAPFSYFDGPFISRADFHEGQLHGSWLITDMAGRRILEIELVFGERHGTTISWHPQGHKMQEIPYRNGLMHGLVKTWDDAGQARSADTYEEGRKRSAVTEFYDEQSTQKRSEGIYIHPQIVLIEPDAWWELTLAGYATTGDRIRDGRWTEWHADGTLAMEATFENGSPTGESKWWYANGQLSGAGQYTAGQPDGAWKWWYDDGTKRMEGTYEAGKLIGKWYVWKRNGELDYVKQFGLHVSDGR